MKYVFPVFLVFLVGCASKPEVIYEKVEVPVAVSCLNHDMIPDKVVSASEIVEAGDSPGKKIRAVLIEREQLRLANEKMRVVLDGCLTESI